MLQEAVDARTKRSQLTQDQVLSELVAIGFANIYDAFDRENGKIVFKQIEALPEDIKKAILEMTCVHSKDGTAKISRIKLACKVKALDMLAKHLGFFKSARSSRRSVADLHATAVNRIRDEL